MVALRRMLRWRGGTAPYRDSYLAQSRYGIITSSPLEGPVGISLSKGGNVSLTKEAPGLTAVTVGLGWDVRTTTGTDFDLDASAIACGTSGKALSDKHFVFFNNLTSPGRLGPAHRRQPHR